MNKVKIIILALAALIGISNSAHAEVVLLQPDDFVGFTFWLVSMACLAATVFFFLEKQSVPASWRVSITVAGLVTGIAFINYMYMRQIWVMTGDTSIVYRYIDWFITTPLIMLQFYFVLSTTRKVPNGIFWRLLIGSIIMICGGYLGEAVHIKAMFGFIVYMVGWICILYEVFSGEAGRMATKSGNKAFVTAFGTMRMIVTIGWAVYPLGYLFGYLDGIDDNSLNVLYNVTDLITKIAFGLIIWSAAIQQSGKTR